jgi:hypothetical protein
MAAKILRKSPPKEEPKLKDPPYDRDPLLNFFRMSDWEQFEHLLIPLDEIADLTEQLKDRVEAMHKAALNDKDLRTSPGHPEGQVGDADLYLANGLFHMAAFAHEMWLAFYWDLDARRHADLEEKLSEAEKIRSAKAKGGAR